MVKLMHARGMAINMSGPRFYVQDREALRFLDINFVFLFPHHSMKRGFVPFMDIVHQFSFPLVPTNERDELTFRGLRKSFYYKKLEL